MASTKRPGTPRLKFVAMTLVCLAVSLVAIVQIDRCLLRYRAARLLDDFHSIRLRQSNWSDAQRLMSKWGAFGHYEGTCTASECTYFITLTDIESRIERPLSEYMAAHYPQSYSGITLGHVFAKLGSRYAHMRVGFLVRDGIIQRSSIAEILDVPATDPSCDMNCDGYSLLVHAVANDHLLPHREDFRILGDEEQLSNHPNFKAGSPSGCETCMEAAITFTPYLDQQELVHITAFNMSCFATFHICRTLPEVLPAARDWHLYPTVEGGPDDALWDATRKPCSVPIFALARDAASIFIVDAVSAQTAFEHEESSPPLNREYEKASAILVKVLKGPSEARLNAKVSLVPFAGIFGEPQYKFEDLVPQRRYLIFTDKDSDSGTLSLDHCSVFDDSHQAESDVQKGMSMNDHAQFGTDAPLMPW